ncbi:hypothetical protein EDC04DRAFT_2609241 [Pisolithus marmoratus]|nr:hypothetical protein EDC04DRAFT_2609241 [Pisolithus marmoratus]
MSAVITGHQSLYFHGYCSILTSAKLQPFLWAGCSHFALCALYASMMMLTLGNGYSGLGASDGLNHILQFVPFHFVVLQPGTAAKSIQEQHYLLPPQIVTPENICPYLEVQESQAMNMKGSSILVMPQLLIHALDALQQKAENEDALKLLNKSFLRGELLWQKTNVREQNGDITVSTSYACFEVDGAQHCSILYLDGWVETKTYNLVSVQAPASDSGL